MIPRHTYSKHTIWMLVAVASISCGTSMGFSVLPTAGLFSAVKVSERDFPALRIAYKTYTSSYKDSGKHLDAVKQLVGASPNYSTVGLFLDDPASVPSDKTRYGITIEEGQADLEHKLKANGYSLHDLPKTPAVWTTFPETSLISTIVGKLRVYPKLEEYSSRIRKPAGPFAEVCKNGAKETNFYGMLANRRDFMLGLEDSDQYAARLRRQ